MSLPQVPAEDEAAEGVASLAPSTVIAGKYQVERLIGRGGMGSVYRAIHLGLHQPVAIKMISQLYARSPEARRRFDTEAKAAARLRSRHVVQVFDNGETDDGTPYLVMELLEGESLDRRIARLGRLPIDDTFRIVVQVGRALARAHAMGIVHRDLKPENIYMSREEDGEVAKVLDFGIAKIRNPETGSSGTRTGAVLGTPLFMSPEQARGLKSVDHRTNVYSLGMVIYAMLTGVTAFTGESFGDILVAICTSELPSIEHPSATAAPGLAPGFDWWFQRACAREPGERFQSVDELVQMLGRLAGARGSMLPGDDASTGPGPTDAMAVGRPGGTFSSAGGFASGIRSPEYDEVDPPAIPKRSSLGLVLGLGAALVLVLAGASAVLLVRRSGEKVHTTPGASGLVSVPASSSAGVASAPAVSATDAPAPPSPVLPSAPAAATSTARQSAPPDAARRGNNRLGAASGSARVPAPPARGGTKTPGGKPAGGIDLGF